MALTVGVLVTNNPTFAKPGPIPVTQCGQMLDVPGEYVFSGVLSCDELCPSAAITIRASSVRLSFAPESLLLPLCTGVLISDGISNVVIEGSGGGGFGAGLVIGRDDHVIVRGMNIGDGGGQSAAVEIDGGNDIVIMDSTIGGFYGILGRVNHGEFSRNVIGGDTPGSQGIVLSGHGNVIKDNVLGLGPYFENVSISVGDRNVVKNNVISGSVIGILLAGKFNRVFGNTIVGAVGPDNPMGSQEGIETALGSIHNLIARNLVINNRYDLFESNGPPCVNVWRKNDFQTSSGAVACLH
jgi:hypothetical protein